MTGIQAINSAVIAAVKSVYPAAVFVAQELDEPTKRPAFKVSIGKITSSRYSMTAIERTIPVEIAYFAADTERSKAECITVYEALENRLLGESVGPYTIDTIDSQIYSDGVLQISFTISDFGELSSVANADSNAENMEVLN